MKARPPVADQALGDSSWQLSVGLRARKEDHLPFPLKLGYQLETGEENMCEEKGEDPSHLGICSLAEDNPGGKCHPSHGTQRQCLLGWPLRAAPT